MWYIVKLDDVLCTIDTLASGMLTYKAFGPGTLDRYARTIAYDWQRNKLWATLPTSISVLMSKSNHIDKHSRWVNGANTNINQT